jgi:ABC-type multidrug transport system fused ATPase/permease subunit
MVLGTTLNLQLVSNLFRHLIRLPMSWFERRHLGDVVSRFESLNAIQRTLTASFLEALVDGVMVLLTLVMMLLYSVELALIGAAAATLYALLRFALYRPFRQASEEQIVRMAKQQSHFLETVRGMQSIKLLSREVPRTSTWQNLAVDQFNAGIRAQRLGIPYQGLNGLLFGIENVVTIWLGALLVLDGSGFSVGMLLAFVSYKTQFVQRIANLVEKALELRMCRTTSCSPVPSRRTSASSTPSPITPASNSAPAWRRCTMTSRRCPWPTTPWSGTWARCSPVGSGSASCWPVRCIATRRSWYWTRPPAIWTWRGSDRSTPRSGPSS